MSCTPFPCRRSPDSRPRPSVFLACAGLLALAATTGASAKELRFECDEAGFGIADSPTFTLSIDPKTRRVNGETFPVMRQNPQQIYWERPAKINRKEDGKLFDGVIAHYLDIDKARYRSILYFIPQGADKKPEPVSIVQDASCTPERTEKDRKKLLEGIKDPGG